ncbi:M20 metallopeptidase family protein [Romboutsia sp.]|uniref:M20 metallopeptidase family protein n=1 Tax=Romboutsia sp. TaxID=1965302 RepID=UPI003F3460B2
MKSFIQGAKEIEDYLVEIRRHLHRHPELESDLPKTTKYVKEKLTEIGCKPEEICKSGIVATIGGNKPGKTILLRADMDALPMQEESGLEYTSQHLGIAHTCGHDIHTSFLIGAAKLLKEREGEIEGTIKLMFQPGEESLTGALDMIKSGILESPKVDCAVGMHVQPLLPLNHLNYAKGPFLASTDILRITIQGRSCHASQPHMGIDPINIAAHIILSLQSLQSKLVPSNEPVVLNICEVKSGNTSNVVPEQAILTGTLRTFNPQLRKEIIEQCDKIIKLTSQAFGATSKLEILESCPSAINDKKLVDEIKEYIPNLGIDFVSDPNYRMQVSDDFGFISELVPSILFIIGCKPDGIESSHNHNSKVIYNEEVLQMGAALFAQCAFDYLKNNK